MCEPFLNADPKSPSTVLLQRMTEGSRLDGYTHQGGVAVLCNGMVETARMILECEDMLGKQDCSHWAVNGLLAAASCSLQNDLDRIANFCQHAQPLEKFEGANVYFRSYDFILADFAVIGVLQKKIAALEYDNANFNDFANNRKHVMPWVGMVTENADGLKDVFDVNGTGVVRGFLVPVHKAAIAAAKVLIKLYGCPSLKFPCV
jgi:hypothetical protein